MKMSKLSNQTNSQDPQAVNSRIFVGNLNTFQCSKADVERMFQRYGRLAGISMHKGYAFVQFTNPFDARNACHGEDGRTILSQVLDVNMVAEPKPHQTGRKRQNVTKTGNDWDYYYDSYYASTLFPSTTPPRPVKRQRLMSSPQSRPTIVTPTQAQAVVAQQQQQQLIASKLTSAANNLLQLQQQAQQVQQQQQQLLLTTSPNSTLNLCNNMNNVMSNGIQNIDTNSTCHITTNNNNNNNINNNNCTNNNNINNNNNNVGPFKVYSNPDILICGNCREMFSELNEMMEHKRSYCKLRFTCKCQDQVIGPIIKNILPSKLLCAVCKDSSFSNPWDLMIHVQAAHGKNIYEIGDTEDDDCGEKTNRNEKTYGKSHANGIESQSCENLMEKSHEIVFTDSMNLNGNSSAHDDDEDADELIMNETSTKNGVNEVDTSGENTPILSSPRSNSPSDNGNGSLNDSVPHACIMRALSIDTTTASNSTLSALTLITNGTTVTSQ